MLSTEMAVFHLLTFGVAVVVVLWFIRDQQRIGRFGGQASIAPASDWLDTTLARFPAGVGAAWDNTVSGKEAKAILTRLVLEGEKGYSGLAFAFYLGVLALGSVVSVVVLARATGTKQQVTARKRLEGARELLLQEATGTGSVPDSRLPYVFAFGRENLVLWDADPTPAAFASCGGIAGWKRLVQPFAVPFVTRARVSLD